MKQLALLHEKMRLGTPPLCLWGTMSGLFLDADRLSPGSEDGTILDAAEDLLFERVRKVQHARTPTVPFVEWNGGGAVVQSARDKNRIGASFFERH